MHQITKDGKVLFTGTPDECFQKLLRIQPFSTHYAQRYGGYKIEPVPAASENEENKAQQQKEVQS